jgi:hypothetical protein
VRGKETKNPLDQSIPCHVIQVDKTQGLGGQETLPLRVGHVKLLDSLADRGEGKGGIDEGVRHQVQLDGVMWGNRRVAFLKIFRRERNKKGSGGEKLGGSMKGGERRLDFGVRLRTE